MNPSILERDGVRCNVRELTKLAEAGFALGADELHLQSWGDSHRELVSHALDLVGIDPRRIVVQLPCTDNGIIVRPSSLLNSCLQHQTTCFCDALILSICFAYDVSFYKSTASTCTLATPRTTWESVLSLPSPEVYN